jgi:hypothetical protein
MTIFDRNWKSPDLSLKSRGRKGSQHTIDERDEMSLRILILLNGRHYRLIYSHISARTETAQTCIRYLLELHIQHHHLVLDPNECFRPRLYLR